MMAKKFMYVCIGIFALMGAFHLGAQYGNAGYVDHSRTGIVALYTLGDVLLDDGTVWGVDNHETGWARRVYAEPPVAAADILFWEKDTFVSTSGELWHKESGGWYNYGTPPGGVATEASSWGSIKYKWRDSNG